MDKKKLYWILGGAAALGLLFVVFRSRKGMGADTQSEGEAQAMVEEANDAAANNDLERRKVIDELTITM